MSVDILHFVHICRYDAGDHVAIYPTNDTALVERIGELLSIDLDTVFTMINLDEDSTKKHPFPCPVSLLL